jgi:hypothetical protein
MKVAILVSMPTLMLIIIMHCQVVNSQPTSLNTAWYPVLLSHSWSCWSFIQQWWRFGAWSIATWSLDLCPWHHTVRTKVWITHRVFPWDIIVCTLTQNVPWGTLLVCEDSTPLFLQCIRVDLRAVYCYEIQRLQYSHKFPAVIKEYEYSPAIPIGQYK